MTVMICRECGHHDAMRSNFEAECTECGSDALEQEDSYDPVERELRCVECGYEVDTSTRPDADWGQDEQGLDVPGSVDDPCPICGEALVPASSAKSVRELPEYTVARQAATKLHSEHRLAGPPYDPRQLAERLGLEVVVGPFRHDGMLVDGRIEVPGSAHTEAQRFVIAHEIGHHVLAHEGGRSKIEPEANAFASELLIPRSELIAAIEGNRSATALRGRFGVSRPVIVYALREARAINKVIR